VILGCERIENTKAEAELYQAFVSQRSEILGGFLDILSKAIAIRPNIQLSWRTRMIDFLLWGSAIARSLGYQEGRFLQAYQKNIQAQNQTALAASLVAQAVLAFAVTRTEWTGTPSELLRILEEVAVTQGVNIRGNGWPKSSVWLTRRINEVRINLLAEGIVVKESKSGNNQLNIRRIPKNTVHTVQSED
jgi:hypothetical protein